MDEISFGTDGWRATLDTFTDDRVRIVGQAVADYLADEGYTEPVLIGYDARETSPGFAESLAEVVAGNGFDVLLPERDCPTPLVAYAIADRGLSGALMVTASHNPPEYNGVKFIPSDGAPALPEVTDAVAEHLAEPDLLPESERGTIERVDIVSPHADHAIDLVGDNISGLTVVYDAMHGSGRGVTDALLESAGAEVIRRRCERDADFGGISPEPSEEYLGGLVDAMDEHDADLGVANDGDADRIAIAAPDRGVLDENLFFAAVYDYLLESDSGPAIRTVSTTFLIDRIAEAHGEEVFETAVGFKWVADAMREHDALIGGEESGGFSIRGHVREKDGVLMALLAACAAAEEDFDARLDRISDEFGDIVADKISVECPDSEKARVIDELEDELPETVAGRDIAKVVTLDGFKLLLDDGSWVLVRPSGTEPKMRVYAEAGSEDAVSTLLDAGRDLVEPLV
ncbi:phosphoglucomutase/phosphomannomutase family protein [Haloferax mediterranei ATCC 33500]|uniref:Phosphoglucomutase n=1 Tax=Haloferax mediterranei (strain ATCC 33500 / DSM 1411 / JCM 8866 / NBRC 14739 / NCIMB 2177 / R-4) TaxID=523841 RepID=I3R131_HALMT|nr:phosphoglucomutase/phosphomannomutase family protein [Haloferax mediterranei]AFK17941.1 phosphohexomutase (phosphoglucomutase, phosphomannomutase) [Haloferax mediterranei ATCC 33500]AHZ22637.1 phosphoglucomutase [Haloferax mediterranei ATCC 33500]EMA02781.1 phosphohexomutase (phosphoglucomutase, phosphomannomutase) [Haloferax mediterranei ATCC 33500]MDX5988034.1 phosphoglucomutase/phosphomannomutase family protein [Haloferax mediterranei ATCC 33500]QCQ74495.1 phosphoglucomutase/phosphomanno